MLKDTGKSSIESFDYDIGRGLKVSPWLMDGDVPPLGPIQHGKTMIGVHASATTDGTNNDDIMTLLSYGVELLNLNTSPSMPLKTYLDGVFVDMISLVIPISSLKEALALLPKSTTFVDKDITPYSYAHLLYIDNALTPVYTTQSDDIVGQISSFSQIAHEWLKKGGHHLAYKFDLQRDFFSQIAALRALRILWANMLDYVGKNKDTRIYLLCTMDAHFSKTEKMHPMIEYNYKILSGYLGGCDAVIGPGVASFEQALQLVQTHHIYREESKLTDTMDVMCGSYVAEKITETLVQYGWQAFIKT